MNKGVVVAISGPSGCGKTTLAEGLKAHFARSCVVSLDAFYFKVEEATSWEDPSLFDWKALCAELTRCCNVYDMVFLEGFVCMADESVRDLVKLCIGLKCSKEVAKERRLKRDAQLKDFAASEDYFETYVWPAHLEYEKKVEAFIHVKLDASKKQVLEEAIAEIKRFLG